MAAPDCNRNRFVHGGYAAVTAGLQISPANVTWEKHILKQHSSQNANRIVRLHGAGVGRTAGVTLSDDRAPGCGNQARADLADSNSRQAAISETEIAPADGAMTIFWCSLLTFFMEGFAAYGACMHPTAAFPVGDILSGATGQAPRSASRGSTVAERGHGEDLPSEPSNIVELRAIPVLDSRRTRRWNWLTSLGETVLTLGWHWRREQKIKKTVAALAKLDDRTLRDIGISDRSQIERTVRLLP